MSVPLDRLYDFIDDISKTIYGDHVVIYRFYPFGSKNIESLQALRDRYMTWKQHKLTPELYCNDQEPLNFELYEHISQDQVDAITSSHMINEIRQHGFVLPRKNMRLNAMTIWDRALLLHSEQRSDQVKKYADHDFVPVYYWSHALIARDWFRYAQHVSPTKNLDSTFLIYARGWTGSREYRLKFLELLVNNNLHEHSKISIMPVDQDTGAHYSQHQFENSAWRPDLTLENYLPVNHAISSNLSADFDIGDYNSTEIEVVLETLFDDDRLHFTEKILRPMAMAQPFILAGGYGGLEYLKKYGFQTFERVWSEDYDSITNHGQRMQAIIDLMKQIQGWSQEEKRSKSIIMNEIAQYNKRRFFSNEFFCQVVDELKQNLAQGLRQLYETNTCQDYLRLRDQMFADTDLWNKFLQIRSEQDASEVHDVALKFYNKTQISQTEN